MTEIEERRRKRMPRVLITEILMGATIIILVVFLALMAMGYNLSFDSGVRHSGLVQINSTPTGAAIEVDGEGIFMPTNQSRTMVSGEHNIKLSRDGYSSWEKTIKVTEGMMYRLVYPRLYKLDREKEEVKIFAEDSEYFGLSPSKIEVAKDHTRIYLDYAGLAERVVVSLNDGTVSLKEVEKEKPTEKIADGTIVVMTAAEKRAMEEPSLDTNADAAETLDLTTVETVESAETMPADDYKYYIYIYDREKPILLRSSNAELVMAESSYYYGDDYLSILEDNHLEVYYGDLPREGEDLSQMTEIVNTDLDFAPTTLGVHGKGELIVASNDEQLATLDAESFLMSNFVAPNKFGWLSEFNIYTIADGELVIYDFDGTNSFELATGAYSGYPAVISENDRYIYYFNNDGSLMKETIR